MSAQAHGTGLRLVPAYLASRRVPVALAAVVGFAVLLRLALVWHWIEGTGPVAQLVALPIEGGTAVVIAATLRSPFGDVERASGQWLAWLRLGDALALTTASWAALATAVVGADLPGGDLELLRSVGGLTGIALLSVAVLGGGLAWTGPVAYLVIAEYAINDAWTTPWIWSGRPPHDHGAAICATLILLAGLAVITARGARDTIHE